MLIAKQDKTHTRTPEKLEQKYNFDTRFSEIMGVASDAQRAADEAKRNVSGLTAEQIFNILTNNGEVQGIYRDDDGEIYINASYLRSGVISSADGSIKIDLSEGATEPVFNTGISTNGISVRGDAVDAATLFKVWAEMGKTVDGVEVPSICASIRSADGHGIGALTEVFNTSYEPIGISLRFFNHDQNRVVEIMASDNRAGLQVRSAVSGSLVGQVILNADGEFEIQGLSKINGKSVSWKDNGDGTFTLIGT